VDSSTYLYSVALGSTAAYLARWQSRPEILIDRQPESRSLLRRIGNVTERVRGTHTAHSLRDLRLASRTKTGTDLTSCDIIIIPRINIITSGRAIVSSRIQIIASGLEIPPGANILHWD
jgi:hypothetical protein